MTTANGAQGFGFDAWIQPFREAMAAFAPTATPDTSWPGTGAWGGQMPGMAQPAMGGFEPGAFAAGAFSPGMAGPFAGMLERLSTMSQGQWQQVAAQLSTGAMGGGDAMGPWRNLLQAMAPAAGTFDAFARQGMNSDALRDALSTPPVGPLREHVARWQQAMLAQLDYQEASQAFSAQFGEIMKLAMAYFERRLAARSELEPSPASMRAVFDEWIEAGEQAWAERAGTDAFVAALGRYTNAQLRVRAAMNDQINRIAQALGLPTRGEVDADHRRIAMLERELRRMRAELEGLCRVASRASVPTDVTTPRVVPIRPEGGVVGDAAPASRRAKVAKKAKVQKNATRTNAPAKRKKPERPMPSVAVLPIVTAPRAIGNAPTSADAPRRRAST